MQARYHLSQNQLLKTFCGVGGKNRWFFTMSYFINTQILSSGRCSISPSSGTRAISMIDGRLSKKRQQKLSTKPDVRGRSEKHYSRLFPNGAILFDVIKRDSAVTSKRLFFTTMETVGMCGI